MKYITKLINILKHLFPLNSKSNRKLDKADANKKCEQYIEAIDVAIKAAELIFSDKTSFIDPIEENNWLEAHSFIIEATSSQNLKKYRKASQYKLLIKKQHNLYLTKNSLKGDIALHNDNVAKQKAEFVGKVIGNVEGHPLDQQQLLCIAKNTHNHLVIAGAGTGKTTTVIGKVKYLLKAEKYALDDILVLSFTNASASEMNERIKNECGANVHVSTFHKLGLNIIKEVEGITPRISQLNFRKFIRESIEANLKSACYLHDLISFLIYHRVIAKSEFDFKTQGEYEEYLKLNPPMTLKGETVKSYGEMDIANFLEQNNVLYKYEHPYEVDTRTVEYQQYCPDFYLPEYGIYIEYFGINRNGEVPPYFRSSRSSNPTKEYQDSIKWKREIHSTNATRLIECYSYEKFEGILLQKLEDNLKRNGVRLSPKSEEEFWESICKKEDRIIEGIIELFETVINLIKSCDFSINDLRAMVEKNASSQSTLLLLSLIEPVYNSYQELLQSNGEIDFNDMINTAAKYVKDGKYVNPYKYVIVDEYQDISKARFNLLSCLRQSSDYMLFCVGDDWQSIYRFAGSDIGFILNFEFFWGKSEISKIETTYRFPRQLIEISSSFIMKNPSQIRKEITSNCVSSMSVLGEICGYTEKASVDFLIKKLDDLPPNSTVFFIGRYSFDIDLFKDNASFNCRYNNLSNMIDVVYSKRRDLKICYLTAHKAKGLQADYVFIINNKNSRMGFPSQIQDAPILDLLLESNESFPHSEERRLFYVALTRAKKKVFIVTKEGNKSVFAIELRSCYEEELKREKYECPRCGGRIIKKTGVYGDFFGCSNYRSLGCRYTRNIISNNKT